MHSLCPWEISQLSVFVPIGISFASLNAANGTGFLCPRQTHIAGSCSPEHGCTQLLDRGICRMDRRRNFSPFPHTKTPIFIASRQKKNGWTLLVVLGFAASNRPAASLLSDVFCIPIHLLLCPSLFCPSSRSLYLIVLLFSSSEACWGSCKGLVVGLCLSSCKVKGGLCCTAMCYSFCINFHD